MVTATIYADNILYKLAIDQPHKAGKISNHFSYSAVE